MPQGCPGRCARRRITALFEAQLIRDSALCHECCGHKPLHETARVHMETAWEGDIEVEGSTGYSEVVRVGTDDTVKRCDQSCISIMADLDRQRARTITEGKGQR